MTLYVTLLDGDLGESSAVISDDTGHKVFIAAGYEYGDGLHIFGTEEELNDYWYKDLRGLD